MKKYLLITTLFLMSLNLFAQERYWTAYNFSVESKDIETVAKIANDFFSNPGSKADGVTVYLFENHFSDNDNNFTHSVVFRGTLDAMGNQYSPTGGVAQEKFQAFQTKISQFAKAHSSSSGCQDESSSLSIGLNDRSSVITEQVFLFLKLYLLIGCLDKYLWYKFVIRRNTLRRSLIKSDPAIVNLLSLEKTSLKSV